MGEGAIVVILVRIVLGASNVDGEVHWVHLEADSLSRHDALNGLLNEAIA